MVTKEVMLVTGHCSHVQNGEASPSDDVGAKTDPKSARCSGSTNFFSGLMEEMNFFGVRGSQRVGLKMLWKRPKSTG